MKVACCLLALIAGVAAGSPVTAEAGFFKRLKSSDRTEAVVQATFDDDVCFRVRGTAPEGEHVAEINVYDGAGREVARVSSPLRVKSGRWSKIFCYGFKDDDSPGEWWYVASLDDRPVISESLIVSRGQRP